jgi:anaerobic magnesium-protoporphyrin IX monomethyl ester cyclase
MKIDRKTKILLIFPPSTIYGKDPTVPSITPPLGLAYIAAYLEKYGYEVYILDAVISHENLIKKGDKVLYGLTDKEILKKIKSIQPDLIGISCLYTAYAGDAHRVAKIAKNYNRNLPVIIGGAHASIFPELVLKDKNIDLVVLGEGELTMLDIIKHFESKKSLFNISGTAIKKKGKVIKNKQRQLIENLDLIPFPAWHLLDMKRYLMIEDSNYVMRKPGMVMISSRGCPGHCIYCSIHAVWKHSWRGRSPQNVVGEIEKLHKEFGINEFYFMDDSMGVSKPRLKLICEEIIKRKINIRWTTPNGIAHWSLDERILDLMKKAGCYRITFGIESGDENVRRFIGKPYSLDQAKKMIRYANRIGMWTICTNIIGFPEETKEQIQKTINFAVDSDTDLAIFYLLCPHPGTEIYENFKKLKLLNFDYIFTPDSVTSEKFAEIGLALSGRGVGTKFFTKSELQIMLSEAYASFMKVRIKSFLNPLRIKSKIHSWEDLRFTTKIGLSMVTTILRSFKSRKFASQLFRHEID